MSAVVRTYEPNATIDLISRSLRQVATSLPSSSFVCVGDVIDTENQDGFLRGHGTQLVGEQLVATVCGVVERINKLIYVKPLKARYSAELGDVVVGRVAELAGKRWKVELHSRQEASLLLSAVHLPGGVQRRRTAEDELHMREVFREGALLSAEVQSVHSGDGSVMLHTRSLKYGKLAGGQLVEVAAGLVRRQRTHFVTLDAIGVDLILGLNGLIWVSPHVERGEDGAPLHDAATGPPPPSPEQRAAVCRVANAVRALERLYLPIAGATIQDAYELSLKHQVPIKDMTEMPFLKLMAESEAVRRHAEAAAAAAAPAAVR